MASKIKKGDKVIVLSGKSKGLIGEVLFSYPKKDRVIVQGVNKVKRHMRASSSRPSGIDEKEASLHISNVALFDPETKRPTRVGFKIEDGKKVRFLKSSGITIK